MSFNDDQKFDHAGQRVAIVSELSERGATTYRVFVNGRLQGERATPERAAAFGRQRAAEKARQQNTNPNARR